MKKDLDLIAESLKVTSLLALVGGFLDAYTYLTRGKVFANAQTGNMVLFGVGLIEKDFFKAIHYFIPVFSFFIGIFLAELIRKYFKKTNIHWRQIIVIFEIILLAIVAYLPLEYNTLANVIISFVCSLQVQSFKKVHNLAFATTMCTGNLMKSSYAFFNFQETKDKIYLIQAFKYLFIIMIFIIGAMIGSILVDYFYYKSIIFCCITLTVVLYLIHNRKK